MKSWIENTCFRWNLDDGGDLVLSFCGLIHVTFYKWPDTAILKFGRKKYTPASKSVWRAIQNDYSMR